jgi:hypothetical protein
LQYSWTLLLIARIAIGRNPLTVRLEDLLGALILLDESPSLKSNESDLYTYAFIQCAQVQPKPIKESAVHLSLELKAAFKNKEFHSMIA